MSYKTLLNAAGAALLLAAAGALQVSAAPIEPAVSNVMATSTDTSALITWNTDEPATAQVAYGTSTSTLATTTLDSTLMTTHAVPLAGLVPGTTYHFEAMSMDAAGSSTQSLDQTFMTAPSSTSTGTSTATGTSAHITLSDNNGAPGATTTAMGSGFAPLEEVSLAFWAGSTTPPGMMASTTATSTASSTVAEVVPSDKNGTFTAILTIPNLPQGSAILAASGLTSGRMATSSFMILAAPPSGGSGTSTGTSTASSTPDIGVLQNELNGIKSVVAQLQNEIAQLQSQIQSILGGGAGNPPPPTNGAGQIDQNGTSVRAGTSIDFGGHNFGKEEHVSVMLNGSKIGTGFTNLAGSFSTGSMSVPATPGSYTYTFTGELSGIVGSATITVTS